MFFPENVLDKDNLRWTNGAEIVRKHMVNSMLDGFVKVSPAADLTALLFAAKEAYGVRQLHILNPTKKQIPGFDALSKRKQRFVRVIHWGGEDTPEGCVSVSVVLGVDADHPEYVYEYSFDVVCEGIPDALLGEYKDSVVWLVGVFRKWLDESYGCDEFEAKHAHLLKTFVGRLASGVLR